MRPSARRIGPLRSCHPTLMSSVTGAGCSSCFRRRRRPRLHSARRYVCAPVTKMLRVAWRNFSGRGASTTRRTTFWPLGERQQVRTSDKFELVTLLGLGSVPEVSDACDHAGHCVRVAKVEGFLVALGAAGVDDH